MSQHQQTISVAVSGIGIISAAGDDVDANFANMIMGRRCPKAYPTLFDSEIHKPVFECNSSVLDDVLLPSRRTFALCIKALNEALSDADLTISDLQNLKVGVCIGTTVACTLNDCNFYDNIRKNNLSDILPLERYLCGDISLSIADLLGVDGATLSITNACASGSSAIAIGYNWIKSGEYDLVITGGADELNLIPYCGFNALLVMSDELCLPFDKRRKGLNLGEGAGIVILENNTSAFKRGKTSEVELLSCGEGSDAYHITGPDPAGKGLKNAISASLKHAAIQKSDINYINAHGTSTINNDKVEATVFADMFGDSVPFASTKYFTGHTLAAAGAIEAAICVKGIREGRFPGMLDVQKADDVIIAPTTSEITYTNGAALSTSMAFGGSCVALMFAKSSNRLQSNSKAKKQVIHLKAASLPETSGKIVKRLTRSANDHITNSLQCISTGIIGPFGMGKEKFKHALRNTHKILPLEEKGEIQSISIPEEELKNAKFKHIRRRADKLSLAMYCAALEAMESVEEKSPQGWQQGKTTALIAVSTFGAYKTTFRFLDGLLDFGHFSPSPTHFSNSVHNAPAFYISSGLHITGPSVTVTGFNNPFRQALFLAETFLKNDYCDQVMVVAGDEVCNAMLQICNLWFKDSKDKTPRVLGEGAAAFLFKKHDLVPSSKVEKPDETAIRKDIDKLFGHTLINNAFAMAAEIVLQS